MPTDPPAPWLAERGEIRAILEMAARKLAVASALANDGMLRAVPDQVLRGRLDVDMALRLLERDAPGWHQAEAD